MLLVVALLVGQRLTVADYLRMMMACCLAPTMPNSKPSSFEDNPPQSVADQQAMQQPTTSTTSERQGSSGEVVEETVESTSSDSGVSFTAKTVVCNDVFHDKLDVIAKNVNNSAQKTEFEPTNTVTNDSTRLRTNNELVNVNDVNSTDNSDVDVVVNSNGT